MDTVNISADCCILTTSEWKMLLDTTQPEILKELQ